MFIQDSRRSYGTYTYSTDTGVPIGTTELIQIQDLSDTGVPVGTTEQIRYGQNLIKCRSTRRYYRYKSTRRYYWTYTYFTNTGVPIGTTELIQLQDLSDTGVPVGTTEQISYGQNLIKCWSTRKYYRTDQIQDRTYQIQEYP